MDIIIFTQLFVAILLRISPPKKPNFYFGYQLGSAKKSIEHWKTANKYASGYMILFSSLALILSIVFDYIKYDGIFIILTIMILGFVLVAFLTERKLKTINFNCNL